MISSMRLMSCPSGSRFGGLMKGGMRLPLWFELTDDTLRTLDIPQCPALWTVQVSGVVEDYAITEATT